jgi:hypothetical protein
MTDILSHWDKVYQTKDHTQVSWHQDRATLSFDWILKYTKKMTLLLTWVLVCRYWLIIY